MEYLPQEIVLDILSRLPVASKLPFKLVCRAWNNLAAKNDPCLILHCDYPIRNELYYLELSSRDKEDQMVNKIRVPMLPEFDVIGSCHGLLCLCDSSTTNQLYVYNPFTRDYKELPQSVDFNNQDRVFGFGCHPATKQYKIVKIDYRRCGRRNQYGKSEVQILTLGSSSWRRLCTSYHLLKGWSQVFVSGRLHWCTWPRYGGRFIVSFDLEDEKFRVVPGPRSGELKCCYFELVDLGGCLSAAVPCNGEFKIWVMNNYGVKESWIKKFFIGSYVPRGLELDLSRVFRGSKFYRNSSYVRILCLLEKRDILLQYKCRALVSYNPESGTFKDILFNEMPFVFEASVHEVSLNSIAD